MARALKISRTSVYKILNSVDKGKVLNEQIIKMVLRIRKRMPRIGTLKLYDKLRSEFNREGIKCGRDKFIKILKDACMLVPKKKNSQELQIQTTCLTSILIKLKVLN